MVGAGYLLTVVFIMRVPDGPPDDQEKGAATAPAVSDAAPSAGNLAHSVAAQEQTLIARLLQNPDDEIARIEMARFYHDSHRPSEAAEHYAAFLEVSPENRQVWMDFADCLVQLGEWNRARDAMTTFLERWPEDPEGMYNLGAILANAGSVRRHDPGGSEFAASALIRILPRRPPNHSRGYSSLNGSTSSYRTGDRRSRVPAAELDRESVHRSVDITGTAVTGAQ